MSDIDQVLQIATVLGSPSEKYWPEVSGMPDHGKILFKDQQKIDLVAHIVEKYGPVEAGDLLELAKNFWFIAQRGVSRRSKRCQNTSKNEC